jgi:KDO2-lipid IV(A) lauroyltransferase
MLKYTLMLLGSRLVKVLPTFIAYFLACRFADLAYLTIPKRRTLLARNIALITGKTDKKEIGRLVKSAYRHSAKNMVDFLMFPYLTKERIKKMARCEGLEDLDRAVAKGKGVVFITSHLGHWEFGGALLASLGYSALVIAESIAPKRKMVKKERIASLFRDFREKTGMVVIPMESLMTPVVRALKKGKIVVFVADRDITGEGVEVTFFGRKCRLPRGPAFFSLRLDASLILGYIVRNGEVPYLGVMEKEIPHEGLQCDENGIRELTQRMARVMESVISKYPDQWFVFEPVGEETAR